MSKKLPPIHPGEILREEFMKPMGLSSTGLAHALEVTPARVNEIIRERRGITADTALRLARFFGTDVQSWLNLQTHYDIQCAEDAAGRTIQRIRPRQSAGTAPTPARLQPTATAGTGNRIGGTPSQWVTKAVRNMNRARATEQRARVRTVPPVSPGEMLDQEFLQPLGLTKYRLAKEIGVPPQRIGDIVAGKRAVTADTDLRLCRYFGLSDGWWLRGQANYDTAIAREAMGPALARIVRRPLQVA